MENYTRPQLAEQVAASLQNEIMNGSLKPGEKLPNEHELAQQLGVGRGTIREAVKQLVAGHVLEVRQGSGTYVSLHPGHREDPLGFAFVADKRRLTLDLLEFRQVMEPAAAALAAQRATAEDRAAICARCDACEACIRLGIDYAAADVAFHQAIAIAAHNLVVADLVPVIHQGLNIFADFRSRAQREDAVQAHRQIADAICRGDKEQASAMMERHLLRKRRDLFTLQMPGDDKNV